MSRAPYKYLDYYTFEDADIFFGREEETQKMVGEILSTRLLVLFSPSGSGKTSLINAGVRPALEKLGYQTVYVRLDKEPIPSVQSAVAEALALSTNNKESHSESRSRDEESFSISQAPPSKEISRFARNDNDDVSQNDLHGFFKNVTRKTEKPLVVFIDQFEEFFIVFENKQEARRKFIEQVAKIKYDDTLPVFLVFSLREDYFANLHEFREAIPSIFQNNANIRLEPFTEAEARRAIEEPAKVVGCEYEAGLVERMLQDLKNGKTNIEPITLQIVCDSVWRKKPANAGQITATDYQASGGAAHILKNHVSRLLNELPLRQQSLMAKVFEALKTPDDTKRYRAFSDLRKILKIGAKRLQAALKQLAGLSLLRHEERAGDHWYEFKHDYLVREITAWLKARRERIAKRRLWYGLAPGVALLLGLLVYLFIQYNSFYAGTVTPENIDFQEDEIAIFRDNPFHQVAVTTGYGLSQARNNSTRRAFKKHFNLGYRKNNDWVWLASKLEKVEDGKFLYRLGKIQVALDTLVAALKDQSSSVRTQAAAALVNLGHSDDRVQTDKVISALVAALKDQYSSVRTQATAALGNLGQSDDRVISALVAALKDQESDVRSQAAAALGNLGQSDDRVISALVAALKDQESFVRTQAAAALVNLGHSDDRVISALVAALTDQYPNFRYQAAAMLGNLGQSDDRVISALVAVLKDQYPNVRYQAAAALGNLGQSDDRVISALLAALKDQESDVRTQAAAALVNLGHSDDRVISALLAALKDQNWNVRTQAAAALGNLGKSDDRVISALLAALKDGYRDVVIRNYPVRTQAAAALVNLGQSDDRVISALVAALKDQESFVRTQAAAALVNLGQSDDRVISALVAALKDQNWNVRTQAAAALGNLGQSDDRVISALVAALKDQYSSVRTQAAAALGNLGKSDDRVISALVAALKDEESFVRTQAAAALGNLGKSDDRVISALVAALKDQNWNVRTQVAAALVNLGHSDDRVISALVAALKDQESFVRTQAAAALGNLLKPKREPELLALLANNLSGFRTAGAQALARQDSLSPALLQKIAQLRQNERPWVCLAAWEAHELIQARLKSEAEARKLLRQADSVFASRQFSVASNQYEAAFDILKGIIRVDSIKTARAKFQQARCAAKLKRVAPALDDLKIAFEYHPTWRDTLQAELAQPSNDWAILQGNWYLREVLLKKR